MFDQTKICPCYYHQLNREQPHDDRPPEPTGKWFSFAEQPPTVEGMYLVFTRAKWNGSVKIRYAWYAKPPATPWLSHPRQPYCRDAVCVDGVTHWMILPPPEPFDPFLPQAEFFNQ